MSEQGVRPVTYLEHLAEEIRQGVPKDVMPDGDRTSLFLMYAVLLLAKGVGVTMEDVHNAWGDWMLARGEEHHSLVPFSELDAKTQAEDLPFVRAIREVVDRRGLMYE